MENSEVKNKIKIQKILNDNTIRAIGDFHVDELDVDSFFHELQKKFSLNPKEKGEEVCNLLEKIVKLSTVKVRGMFNSKEVKHNKLIKNLFNTFEIKEVC